ncbi:hypothetical protein DFJ63DRAFT_206243 [Scheffersomyces coipomensis]|uniref:uncharacterized protein n=1 Tax=Scheffersomyces coipomensis TaxID=1788519 RepID=UPI00315CF3A3
MDSIPRSGGDHRPNQRKGQTSNQSQNQPQDQLVQQHQQQQIRSQPVRDNEGMPESLVNNGLILPSITIPNDDNPNDVIEISSDDDEDVEVTEVRRHPPRVVDVDNDSFMQDSQSQSQQRNNEDDDDDDIQITGSNNNPVPLNTPIPIISSHTRRRDSPRPPSSLDTDGVEADDEIEITDFRPLSSLLPLNNVEMNENDDIFSAHFDFNQVFAPYLSNMFDAPVTAISPPLPNNNNHNNQSQSRSPIPTPPINTQHNNTRANSQSHNHIHRVRISNGDQIIPRHRHRTRHNVLNNNINNNSRVSFATDDVIINRNNNPDSASPTPFAGPPVRPTNFRHLRTIPRASGRYFNQAFSFNQALNHIRQLHNLVMFEDRGLNQNQIDETENSIMQRIERDNEHELDNRITRERNFNKRILEDKQQSIKEEKSGYVNDIKSSSNLCCEVCAIILGEGIPSDFKPNIAYNENYQKYVQQYRVNAPWFCITQCSPVDIELSKRIFVAKCGHVYCGRCVKNIGNRPRKTKSTPSGYTIHNPQVYAPHSCAAKDCQKRLTPKSFTELYY